MRTPDPSAGAERLLELMTAIDQVRDIRLERSRTDAERAKVIADYEAVRETMKTLLNDVQEGETDQSRL